MKNKTSGSNSGAENKHQAVDTGSTDNTSDPSGGFFSEPRVTNNYDLSYRKFKTGMMMIVYLIAFAMTLAFAFAMTWMKHQAEKDRNSMVAEAGARAERRKAKNDKPASTNEGSAATDEEVEQNASPAEDQTSGSGANGATTGSDLRGINGPVKISLDKAKDIALSDARVNLSATTFIKSVLELDSGRYEYDIEFVSGGKKYEYEIDANSGAIIERSVKQRSW